VVASPDALLSAVAERVCWRGADNRWLARWAALEATARDAVDSLLNSWDEPFEGRVVRDLAAALPGGPRTTRRRARACSNPRPPSNPRAGLRWLANRGANGIDGFVSTVLGVSRVAAPASPVVGVLGDLTFLHDAGGLLRAAERTDQAVLVVLDNDGGGIFSFLPQAAQPAFEELFGTPHGLDLAAVAASYGVPARRATRAADVVPAVLAAVADGGVQVVIVPTGDRTTNVARHHKAWSAVAQATATTPTIE